MKEFTLGHTLDEEQLEKLNTDHNRNWSRAEVVDIASDTGRVRLKVYDQRGHADSLYVEGDS